MKAPSAQAAAVMARWIIIAAGSVQVMASIAWSVWMVRAYRREKKRSKEGLCMTCGFDLRHSEGRCPECGARVFKK